MEEVNEWTKKMNEISPALAWLRKAGCKISEKPAEDKLTCKEYIESAKTQYKCLGELDGMDSTKILALFYNKPSEMFIEKIKMHGISSIDEAKESLAKTMNFFKKLVAFDDMVLSDLDEIKELQGKIADFGREVDIIYGILANDLGYVFKAHSTGKDIIQFIREADELLEYSHNIEPFLDFISLQKGISELSFSLEVGLLSERSSVREIVNKIKYSRDKNEANSSEKIRIKESTATLNRIREIVGDGLSKEQLSFFENVSDSIEAIKFFVEIGKDFDNRSAIVRSQHVGSVHESEIINNAIGVHNTLSAFIDLISGGEKGNTPLKEVCEILNRFIPKDKPSRDKLLHEIKCVAEKVNELRTWFIDIAMKPTIESLYPLVKAIRESHSEFEIYFDPGSTEPHLRIVVGKKEERFVKFPGAGKAKEIVDLDSKTERELKEHMRGVKIFLELNDLTDENSSDDKDIVEMKTHINEYMRAYSMVWKVGEVYRKLIECGYPNDAIGGQESHEAIRLPIESSVLEKIEGEMNKKLDDWKKCVRETQEGFYWFMLLDQKNFSELFHKLGGAFDAMRRGREPKNLAIHSIYPFLWKCFPDKWETLLAGIDSDYTTMLVIKDMAMKVNFSGAETAEKMETLVALMDTLRKNVLKDRQPITTIKDLVKGSNVIARPTKECVFCHVLKKDASQNDVYMELARIYKSLIHPSFVFTCNGETSSEVMKNFLGRLRLFPDKSFSILHPGRLRREAREYLVGWVSKQYKEGSTVGNLHIIVRRTEGDEIFGFAARYPTGSSDVVHPKRSEMNNKNIKLEKLTWYETGPLTGKTTHIRKQVKDFVKESLGHEKRYVRVSVAEDFQASSFIKTIRDELVEFEGESNNILVHFNVSPYGPLEEFGVFLYNLLAWGIIVDKGTGEVFYVGTKFNWYIAVEISAAQEGDDDCPFDTIEKVKGAIPLVERFFEPEKVEEIELDTDSEDFLFCLAGFAVSYPESPKFPDLNMKRASKSLKVEYVYEFYSKVDTHDKKRKFSDFIDDFIEYLGLFFDEGQPKTIAILARLVKLMSDRFRSLWAYCKGNYTPVGNLFTRFYNCLYLEMKQFTKVPLDAPTSYILFQNERDSNPKNRKILMMDFTDGNALEKKKEEGYDMFEIMKLEEIHEKPELLYDLLNGAFKVNNAKELLEGRRYVLTPDFTIKLLFMCQCLGAGKNVVLSGDAGTGKSELLETFAVLANAGSPHIPDNLEETYRFAVEKGIVSNVRELSVTDKRIAIIDGIKRKSKNPDELPGLRNVVASFIKGHLEKYKLLRGSDFLESIVAAAFEKDPTKKESELGTVLKTEEEIIKALNDVWYCKMPGIFHRLQMHQHITPTMFREMVGNVVQSAEELNKLDGGSRSMRDARNPELRVVAFIDNCTSTSVMGLVKEVLINKTISGMALPENIMWVGAFNRNMNKNSEIRLETTTGMDDDGDLDFAVRPAPESLTILEIRFGRLSPKQQEHFLAKLVELRGIPEWEDKTNVEVTKKEREDVRRAIRCGQRFLEENPIRRVHPSIRDIVRCMDLYAYFRKKTQFLPTDSKNMDSVHMHALVLAVMMAYYSRVPMEIRPKLVQKYREERLPEPVKEEAPKASQAGDRSNEDPFLRVFKEAAMILYENTAEVEGIVPTHSFLQNLFFVVVCIDAKIPLMIYGPPGCSKTLSFTIAMANMKGSGSPKNFYKKLSHVYPLRYQCSLDSADTEVEAVYKNAEYLQSSFDESQESGRRRNVNLDEQRLVVLLDEAGLPDERKAPLKVLHYKLDHPRVSSVILTNRILDAAKTNRAVLLIQTEPTLDDLKNLARKCIYRNELPDESVVSALAQAYSDIIKEQDKDKNDVAPMKKFFHMRDFVYLLRHLQVLRRDGKDVINPKEFARALKRNFGGVPKEQFRCIAGMFGKRISEGCLDYKKEEMIREAMGGSVLDTIKESMAAEIDDPQYPNNAAFRDIIVVDPGNSEAAISMVKKYLFPDSDSEAGKKKNDVRTIHVKDFSRMAERDGEAETEAIAKMKDAMGAEDATVFLINGLPISSSFYDLFNRHYDVLPVAREDGDETGEKKYLYFTNISVGSISQPSRVSPHFRVIVHIPFSMLRQTPAPFLNRFEKYYVSLSEVLEKEISSISKEDDKRTIMYALEGCRQMIRHFGGKRLLFGYVEGETLESIFIRMVKDYKSSGKIMAPRPFQSNVNQVGLLRQEASERFGKYIIGEVMKCLLQLGRPEGVISETETLPEDCLEEYFSHQEHFFATAFLDSVLRRSNSGNKWCIFTKTTGAVKGLCLDNELGKKIRESLFEGLVETEDVYAFALGHVASSDDWTNKREKIDDEKTRTVVCVVDMSVCTADQVNVVREHMNEVSGKDPRKRFFLIMHFPLELSVLHSYGVGQAIFADGWNYQYVESLGVTSAGERAPQTSAKLVQSAIFNNCDVRKEIEDRVKKIHKALSKREEIRRDTILLWEREWNKRVKELVLQDARDILRGEKHMGVLNNIGAMFDSFCFEKAAEKCGISHKFGEELIKGKSGGGSRNEQVIAVCEKMYGSAFFLALHALHPLVSYTRSKASTGQGQNIAECMKSFCGIELDKELEEIGSQDISTLEEFVTEICRRIEDCTYLFKDIDIEFNENSVVCDETLKDLERKINSCTYDDKKAWLNALEELYEALNVRYAYLYKHKRLFDLISKQYEAFSEDSKKLLSGTFGEKSTLETANYGQIMRWICIRIGKLRKEIDDGISDESHERYDYGASRA